MIPEKNYWMTPYNCKNVDEYLGVKFSRLFRTELISLSRQFIRICNFSQYPLINFALRGTWRNNWHCCFFVQVLKKSTDNLMNDMQPLVLVKGSFFQEKSDQFQFLAISIHQVRDARRFSWSFIIEQGCAGRNLLIETMIGEIEEVVLKKIEYFYRGDSYKDALTDTFRITGIRSDEPNTILESRVAIHHYKNVERGIDSLIGET